MKIIAFTNKADQNVDNLTELYLPCPRSNRRSVYFQNEQDQLYEIQKVTGPGRKSAWLLDSNIYKDGAVRFFTPLDPLFMALPILEQASKDGNYKTLDDIFCRENVKIEVVLDNEDEDEERISEEYSKPIDVHRLTNFTGFKDQLQHLCDFKEIASNLFVYKLNEEKTLNWLNKKVDAILLNSTFKRVFDTAAKNKEEHSNLEAVYTLSNYLNKDWFHKLLTKLELEERNDELGDISNYVTDVSPMGYFKRVHHDERLMDEAPAKKKKPAVPRSLAKVNTTGMKSITSFFAKKK